MSEIIVIGQIEAKFESTNRVYDKKALCPTISTCGGGQQPKVIMKNIRPVAMRGRNQGDVINQRIEQRNDGISNAITTVQKDCMYMAQIESENIDQYLYKGFGVFKLTPRECGRLMGVRDEDIDRMMEVNSNTQLYKQFGNSICVPVLEAIFRNLNIKGVKTWNEVNDEPTNNERT